MADVVASLADLASPWAYIIIGLLAMFESAAFVGLAVPGETAVTFGGFLVFRGNADLEIMLVVTICGAIAGDSIGYEIGRRFGPALRESRLGRRVGAANWDRGAAYLRAKGGRAVFFGRWIGLLRALVPALAGMARMRYRIFFPFNVAAGALWATTFVFIGYVAGSSYERVSRYAGRATFLLFLIVVVAVVLWFSARAIIRRQDRIVARWQRFIARPRIERLRARYRRQLAFAVDRLRPSTALGLWLTVAIAFVVVTGWAFGTVVADVVNLTDVARVDPVVTEFMVTHTASWLTTSMRALTRIGGTPFALATAAVMAGIAWSRRRFIMVVPVIVAVAGGIVTQALVKDLVERPRPPLPALTDAVGWSFPSGHATAATALYGSIVLMLMAARPRWATRVWMWAGAIAIIALVAFSRVYLRVHYLSDVLAGVTLGALWIAIGAVAGRLARGAVEPPRAPRPSPLA